MERRNKIKVTIKHRNGSEYVEEFNTHFDTIQLVKDEIFRDVSKCVHSYEKPNITQVVIDIA